MHDATAEAHDRQPEPELAHPPAPSSSYNPADAIPRPPAPAPGLLGPAAGTTVAAIESLKPDLLIHLAFARKLELIQASILSVKARADHAQLVASSALNMHLLPQAPPPPPPPPRRSPETASEPKPPCC